MKKLAVFIATWFYTGLAAPFAPGTWGSIATIPLCLFLVWLTHIYSAGSTAWMLWVVINAATIGLLYVLGRWSIPPTEKYLGSRQDYRDGTRTRDQSQIVIDEALGMCITNVILTLPFVHVSWLDYAYVLIAFRTFDIAKPWPVKKFDRMHSAAGVMLDDVAAGVYGAVVMAVVVFILKI